MLASIKGMLNQVPLIPASDGALDQAPGSKGYIGILAMIVAFSVGAQWFYYYPKLNTDAQIWINIARTLGDSGELAYSQFYYERIFLTGFLALAGKVIPLTAGGVLTLVLALSAATVFLVAEITRVAAGRLAGLVAATLFGFHPIVLTFGSFLVSDTLSLPLSLCSLLFITRYMRSGQFSSIAIAAFLGGACFFVKSYTVIFGLAAIAVYIAAWLMVGSGSWQKLLLSVGAFFLPIMLGHVCHWVIYGDPFFYANYYEVYADRVYGSAGLNLGAASASEIVKTMFPRFDYISQLYSKAGVFAGAWSVLATLFLLIKFRLSLFHIVISAGFFGLLGFLMFAPVRMNPLVFVEMQTRYLTLPIAMLAIGGGLALASYQHLFRVKWRADLVLGAVLLMLSGLFVPNYSADEYFHRYRVLDYYAIEKAIETADSAGKLLVPVRYRAMFLEELLQRGVEIEFIDMDHSAAGWERVTKQLKCNCAVFIPRRQYPVLADNVRISELRDISEYGPHEALVKQLETEGFRRSPIAVPYSPLRMLGSAVGLQTKGELVGWIFQRPDND
jgi:hypothetical protein